ncbi:flap endonuclease-1 [Candidatus Woesearchaeota archaeon]|nr:flap endonuclease-1 [Candidatus Woesearchaeota archaeon]
MGIAFKDLLTAKEISIDGLKNKVLTVDSYNMLYQFLTSIRSRDGSLLTDSKGDVTSHLIGLFSRTSKLLEKNLKLVFVFDGEPPKLKNKERERRKALKIEAEKEYKKALKKNDLEEMKKYAARTTRLTKEMVEEAKKLISAFGMPVVQAPSEGEAQAAYIVNKGEAFSVVSQDFDSLIHQAPKLIRNLSIGGKRKLAGKLQYGNVKPEILDLSENLNNLGVDQNQLIALAMLIGTDYNPNGIKGIGPKNALKLVREYKSDFDGLFSSVKWNDFFDFDWEEVYYLIKKMPVTDDYKLEWKNIDFDKMKELLVEKHDFSLERVDKTLEKLSKRQEGKQQKGLGDFF